MSSKRIPAFAFNIWKEMLEKKMTERKRQAQTETSVNKTACEIPFIDHYR